MTRQAPSFDKIWSTLKPFIRGQNVVAHNGSFDFDVLEKTLRHYGIKPPMFIRHCTYRIFGSNLELCCKKYRIHLDHHNPLSDALACAKLFLIHQKSACAAISSLPCRQTGHQLTI
jgi:DNA polymerase-3 subunit epsilon